MHFVLKPEPQNRLVERLRSETMSLHQQLDTKILSHNPFGELDAYIPFLQMQYGFHLAMESIYNDVRLQELFPDLEHRSRLELIRKDLQDLQASLPGTLPLPTAETTAHQALGWLFVSEGSRLGAVALSKRAALLGLSSSHGARHLNTASPDGPAVAWRELTNVLSRLEISTSEEDEIANEAKQAFAYVLLLAEQLYWKTTPTALHA